MPQILHGFSYVSETYQRITMTRETGKIKFLRLLAGCTLLDAEIQPTPCGGVGQRLHKRPPVIVILSKIKRIHIFTPSFS
jgi:hypothetical protein